MIPKELIPLAIEAMRYNDVEDFIKNITARRGAGDTSRTPDNIASIREDMGTMASYDRKTQEDWFGKYTSYETSLPFSLKRRIKIYRGVPSWVTQGILPGDYVTQSRRYALEHIVSNLREPGKIIEGEAILDDLSPVNPNEFWFVPKALMEFEDLEHFWEEANG